MGELDDKRILFVLTEEDAQMLAKRTIKRKLTEEELDQVQKGLEFGLENWAEVMETAILDITEE